MNYVNIPSDKLVLSKPERNVKVQVAGSGFDILYAKLFKVVMDVDLSELRSKKKQYFLLRKDLEEQFEKQVKKLDVRRVNKDTLYLSLGVNKRRTLRVIPLTDITFEKDYGLNDSLYIEPYRIRVEGTESIIDTLSGLITTKLVLKNVHKDIDEEVAINIPDYMKGLSFQQSKVRIKASVSRFSEKIFKLPVEVDNLPKGVSIRLFPEEIEVVCKATIEDLGKISPNDFRVACDYNTLDDESPFLVPQVVQKPSVVRDTRMMSSKIEFLINRQ